MSLAYDVEVLANEPLKCKKGIRKKLKFDMKEGNKEIYVYKFKRFLHCT
jgi:hypothetical protein